ncbi:dTDP-4-dehydrorhamnose reductase [Gaetbulibacter sp. M235]|uniref:dTDP-4-dehydrorhamnose reductase n=1 Tax=Gaetbulibacter sp. M235 TaxID=3126510 RepID=UPI00374E922A
MTTILVTGSHGQLASCIKDVEKKYANLDVIYTDFLELNICDLNQVQAFFKANKQINYCINCAAYTAVDKAENEIDKAFDINARGAKNVALACNEYGVVLIHISTDFVFDGEKSEPYIETDVANPISVYGASKLQGEVEIQQLLKEHFIIRTSWLYSEYGQNFMKTMLRLAETRDEISVVGDQIGTPTYAGDLAEVILTIIDSKSESYGIYHYSNEGVVSWYEFAKAIFELYHKKIKVVSIVTTDYPTPAKRPRYSVLSKVKIRSQFAVSILDWSLSLERTLKKCVVN